MAPVHAVEVTDGQGTSRRNARVSEAAKYLHESHYRAPYQAPYRARYRARESRPGIACTPKGVASVLFECVLHAHPGAARCAVAAKLLSARVGAIETPGRAREDVFTEDGEI